MLPVPVRPECAHGGTLGEIGDYEGRSEQHVENLCAQEITAESAVGKQSHIKKADRHSDEAEYNGIENFEHEEELEEGVDLVILNGPDVFSESRPGRLYDPAPKQEVLQYLPQRQYNFVVSLQPSRVICGNSDSPTPTQSSYHLDPMSTAFLSSKISS